MKNKKGFLQGALTGALVTLLGISLVSVSYTHLDVYKRQVRVMTIHKSKGLEFPVVFVAGMGKGFNMQDVRSNVVLHARLGIGMNHVELEQSTKSPSLIKKVIQKEETLESLGEELRVLYVALTRAKEKLIITGTVENLEKKRCV